MNHDNSAKFSFSFNLAVLFHLWVFALLAFGLSFDSTPNNKQATPMQATVLEVAQPENTAEKTPLIAKNSVAAQKKAARLEQAEKDKLLSAAAQKLLALAEKSEKLERQNKLKRLHLAIEAKIKQVWHQPATIKNLSCAVQVKLNKEGRVKDTFVERSSGNSIFDDAAVSAVYNASPFQMPDDKALRKELMDSFSLNFGNDSL